MSAKIFVICHDPECIDDGLFESPYVPICVGTRKSEFPSYFLRDDAGDNIASKNDTFNEMTAIYWVYKNIEDLPDFVGFNHYRRFFAFSDKAKIYNERKGFDDEFFDETRIENLEKVFEKYDFIAPLPAFRESVEKNFKQAHGNDLERASEIISKEHPDYVAAKDKYFGGNKAYFFNMFVFPKKTFVRYCEWIFPILFEIADNPERENERLFVSERLTGVFISKLEEEGQRGCFLPVTCAINKIGFSNAMKKMRENLKSKTSFVYAIKPIAEWLTPRKIILNYRVKKYKKFENLRTKI